MSNTRQLKRAILKTLVYSSVFNYPLTFYQLSYRLIFFNSITNVELKSVLEQLIKDHKVIQRGKLYYQPNLKVVNWKFRYDFSKKLLSENKLVFSLIGKIPWVKFLGVTGSVAAYNSNPTSDVDILIITQQNRLWLTRGIVALILKILGKYPTHHKDHDGGKICPNLFIDTTHMSWPENKRNLHVAHDIVLTQPIINKDNTYLKFLISNSWIQRQFPNVVLESKSFKEKKQTTSLVLNFFEGLAQYCQYVFMFRKKSTEVIRKNIAHFNKFDNSPRILSQFQQDIEKKVY